MEGAVRLAYRNELNAIKDLDERQAKYESMVASMYERGKALNMATTLEIDNGGLESLVAAAVRTAV